MKTDEQSVYRDKILAKIKSGEVTTHSKSYFRWRGAFWILAALIFLFAAVFLTSFVIFTLRVSGVGDLPQFGAHGWREFFAFFPWLFIPGVLIFIWLMELLARKYSFAYRLPVLYLILVGAVLILLGSFAFLATPLHQRLYESANEDRLPIVGSMYRFFGQDHPDDFYVGDVQSVSGNSYQIITSEGYPATIATDSHTNFFGNSDIKPGDCIEVVGEENGNVVKAYNIKKVPPDSLYPIRHYPLH